MDIHALIQKIVDKLDRIRDLVNQVKNKINGLLSHVPSFLHWVISKVEDLWNRFCDKMSEFWDWFTDKLAYVGDPFLLKDTGEKWNSKLGVPAHKRASEVDSDDLMVDDNWTGTAASAYKSRIGGQKDALDAIGKTYASGVSSALNTMKTGIWIFWIAVVSALVVAVFAFVGGMAAEGTIIGIPVGLLAQIGAVVGFLLAAGGATVALKFAADDSASALRNLSGYSDKWPSFALG
ncbi:hypothetical protein HCC61_10850 [Streptomyces sp. HNM0575]|uniref:hypothetical protein n=1 Tax=Streptomyces sp. HNM0575 TaxID=2716338 RepID=UPI00145D1E06|nr:hypothetical protein [Streptomyces sp. HNM0575]NLU73172.1 hypothetical protein [Streptomyces sp. HNM0575]